MSTETPRTDEAFKGYIANGCVERLKQEAQNLERDLSRVTAKLDPAVSGQGGHNQTFVAACKLVELMKGVE